MSTPQQSQINALTRDKFEVLVDALAKVKEQCEMLTEMHDDHDARIDALEYNTTLALKNGNRNDARLNMLVSNAAAARTNDNNCDRPKKAAYDLDTTMMNTIRSTSQNELADLVIKLCRHDGDTQELAINMLFEGEGKMCSFTSRDLRGSAAGSSKRRRM
jgi:hypothetical protein